MRFEFKLHDYVGFVKVGNIIAYFRIGCTLLSMLREGSLKMFGSDVVITSIVVLRLENGKFVFQVK